LNDYLLALILGLLKALRNSFQLARQRICESQKCCCTLALETVIGRCFSIVIQLERFCVCRFTFGTAGEAVFDVSAWLPSRSNRIYASLRVSQFGIFS